MQRGDSSTVRIARNPHRPSSSIPQSLAGSSPTMQQCLVKFLGRPHKVVRKIVFILLIQFIKAFSLSMLSKFYSAEVEYPR